MKLFVGLGNPGNEYVATWHNVGFMVMDELKKSGSDEYGEFKLEKKFKAEISEGSSAEEKIVLAKPQTFMNKSGESIQALAHFYKIDPADIWIFHDDIDLPLGKIRISQNASAAGHKGVQSIIEHLGTQSFGRFRIGIAKTPPSELPTETYVLQKIDEHSKIIIEETVETVLAAIEVALSRGLSEAMNDFN